MVPLTAVRWLLLLSVFFLSCGYHFKPLSENLPGDIKNVSIPTFKNVTQEAVLESFFTDALVREFLKSKRVQIVSPAHADGIIYGKIFSFQIVGTTHSEEKFGSSRSPKILTREYNAIIDVEIKLKDRDGNELWKRIISDSERYAVGGDPLINESNQR